MKGQYLEGEILLKMDLPDRVEIFTLSSRTNMIRSLCLFFQEVERWAADCPLFTIKLGG